ncbi:MAG: hypothetical protein JKY88_14600 [Pseudomonadales bacterium]|nr:hypothetical protein [Pseudomonadales bacterium]
MTSSIVGLVVSIPISGNVSKLHPWRSRIWAVQVNTDWPNTLVASGAMSALDPDESRNGSSENSGIGTGATIVPRLGVVGGAAGGGVTGGGGAAAGGAAGGGGVELLPPPEQAVKNAAIIKVLTRRLSLLLILLLTALFTVLFTLLQSMLLLPLKSSCTRQLFYLIRPV